MSQKRCGTFGRRQRSTVWIQSLGINDNKILFALKVIPSLAFVYFRYLKIVAQVFPAIWLMSKIMKANDQFSEWNRAEHWMKNISKRTQMYLLNSMWPDGYIVFSIFGQFWNEHKPYRSNFFEKVGSNRK